jgi:hypothetical protein
LPAGAGASGDIPDLWLAVRSLQDSVANLRDSVPGIADFIGLQRAIEARPATAAVSPGDAPAPRLSIAIEGVKSQGSSIELPDFTVVNDQFRQMQTAIARLQVPMYAGGGMVAEPTLAFVAESGPEQIVPGQDFATFIAQITLLNSNYTNLWNDVNVLWDGIRGLVAEVNDALGSVAGGGSDDVSSNMVDRIYNRILLHFHLTQDVIDEFLAPQGFRAFIRGATEIGTEYGLNVLEEKAFDKDGHEDEKASVARVSETDAREDDEDKEEEEFWALLDKIDEIQKIMNKRQGKFE